MTWLPSLLFEPSTWCHVYTNINEFLFVGLLFTLHWGRREPGQAIRLGFKFVFVECKGTLQNQNNVTRKPNGTSFIFLSYFIIYHFIKLVLLSSQEEFLKQFIFIFKGFPWWSVPLPFRQQLPDLTFTFSTRFWAYFWKYEWHFVYVVSGFAFQQFVVKIGIIPQTTIAW